MVPRGIEERSPNIDSQPPAFFRDHVYNLPIFASEKSVSVQNAGRTRPMGETRVDLLHLLEDLRDAYPGSLEETILTEIVAYSLDSREILVSVATDEAHPYITV